MLKPERMYSPGNSRFKTKRGLLAISVFCLIYLVLTSSIVRAVETDQEGCEDYPLFNRLNHFYIKKCKKHAFDRYRFNTEQGPVDVEGRYTFIEYCLQQEAPQVSALQIIQNYIAAVENGGGQVLYQKRKSASMKLFSNGRPVWIRVSTNDKRYRLFVIEEGSMKNEIEHRISQPKLTGTLQPQGNTGRIDLSKVTVSQSPGTAAVSASEPGPQTGAPAPGPLSADDRAAVAAQVNSLTSLSPSPPVSTANIPPASPAQFVLTGAQPRAGNSWMSVLLGFSFPGGSVATPPPHVTIYPGNGNSSVILHFNPLSPNRTYMLDCTVAVRKKNGTMTQTSASWKLEGDIEGNIAPQSGHLLTGFVATGTSAEIKIRPPSGVMWGFVYRCELTKVN